MAPRSNPARLRTAPLSGNQARIDELEYFLDGIGRVLLGPEGEDFRRLADYIPRTRNLSALVALCGRGGERDPGEDLRFLLAELEARNQPIRARETPDGSEMAMLFSYRTYADLLQRPERFLDRLAMTSRLEVVSRLSRGVAGFAPVLARLNALAWLGVVGLPDLEAELAGGAASLVLPNDSERAARGVDAVLALADSRVGDGVRSYYHIVHDELADEYRGQLARLAAKTQPL